MKKTLVLSALLLVAATIKERPAARPQTPARRVQKTAATGSVADVVNAANAFIATLTTTQVATLVQPYNTTTIRKWSNLPCGTQCRIGLQLSTLTAAQQTAALAVVQAATGTVAGDGYDEMQQIRAADDNLAAGGGGNGYGSGLYLIAFLNAPTATGLWQLQFGGHHLATNITFNNGAVSGETPKFEATEPLTFATANGNVFPTGTACAPLANEASQLLAMLNGLTAAQKATARLSQTFNDVLLGPGQDGNFPATKVGLACSTLTAAQQQLVVEAMRPWVADADDVTAASLLATYQAELATTYVAYAGTGNLTTNGDYVRIDGRTVWIEFICQNGIVYRSNIHYHSIWRDHARDYGSNYYTTVTGTTAQAIRPRFAVYPNPALGQSVTLTLATPASATYTLRNALGQVQATEFFTGSTAEVPTAGLAPGVYLLTVQAVGQAASTRKVVVN